MVQLHNLGFPRIGAKRELKYALEDFWAGRSNEASLLATGKALRATHWQHQKPLNWVSVGDFSFYDHVLDMSATLGVLPKRTVETGSPLDHYFRAARGRAKAHDCGQCAASQMTKWFDTNYHYLVPEFHSDTQFTVDATRLLSEYEEATALGFKAKPVIIGPVTYLALGKIKDNSSVLALLPKLIEAYKSLLATLRDAGVQWVQIDEPILTTELNAQWVNAFEQSYHQFKNIRINKLLTTYFGPLGNNLQWASQLPVEGFHLDAVSAPSEVIKLADWLPAHVVLSLGVVNGRNVWKSDLQKILQFLTPIYAKRQSLLWLAPSCSLLHVPVDLDQEQHLDPDIKSWLAFACQKLDELQLLKIVLEQGEDAASDALVENANALASRRNSARVHNANVRQAVKDISIPDYHRKSSYSDRKIAQQDALNLPLLPTTTIGSFAQTPSIRKARNDYKKRIINEPHYLAQMHSEIAYCIQKQEALGIDVLVHGEPERNDMVEYFGELLDGFVITQFAWVQSYGSRCVKPPIIYGDVSRPKAITVDFAKYAQSLSAKPVKGMLTGPVTILNWSFVRDDQPRKDTCLQIALAIRSEVKELEKNGIKIIQIDEPALREGLPLKQSQWQNYLSWAVDAFKLASSVVDDSTQIHTHMCYAEFNDILDAITKLDADVITIETSRSDMELLKAFDAFSYPNDIGPGVYDIHTPNTPTMDNIIQLLEKAKKSIPVERLWVNPDCGLKTRTWDEIIPALEEMVKAAQLLRKKYTT